MAKTLNEILQDFARQGKSRIVSRIQQLSIIDKANLLRSINASVKMEGDNYGVITIDYNYIARFIELGVGNGQKLGQPGGHTPRLFITPVVNELTVEIYKAVLESQNLQLISLLQTIDSSVDRTQLN